MILLNYRHFKNYNSYSLLKLIKIKTQMYHELYSRVKKNHLNFSTIKIDLIKFTRILFT